MGNSRNKILVFAQSAIEGQNIQSQAEYEGSSEREDGVKTGIANGDNFNKLAKQVSTISSSIAEFIVNNTKDIVVGDTSSVEQISGYINQAVTKLITENLPPKEPGINVIDSSSEIVDFNQLTETGVYYIYKDLLNKPYADKICYVLTVLNFMRESTMTCIQLASSYLESSGYLFPAIVNDEYSIRYGNEGMFSPWQRTVALDLSTNKSVSVSKEASANTDVSKYMVISTDEEGNSIFKTASRELMRSALGINALGDNVDLQTDVKGILPISNGGTGKTNATEAYTALGGKALGKMDSIALTDDKLTGVLPVNKGGHGGTNINDARKNLDTCLQGRLPNNVDLNDISLYIPNNIHIYRNGQNTQNRPHVINTGQVITYLDPAFKRGWQEFRIPGIGEVGDLRYWARVYSNNVWGEWKLMRNSDGSIPAELISPTVLKYENSDGTWTETKLSDGTTMLEGYGDVTKIDANQIIAGKTYHITFSPPKKCIEGKIIGNAKYENFSAENILLWVNGDYNSSTGGITFNVISHKTVNHSIISNLKVGSILVNFIFKGILA